jgi:glycosyltransferase involved in cell wall biosynthesis
MVLSRGVDTKLFNPARRSHALRASWGASEATLVVLYLGRLAAEKNVDLVVSSFSAIRANQPTAKLLFVGDGPLRADLEKACPGAIFAGMRKGEDLAAHYASADLFLFPSMTETFGNVTTEALASGLGVVAYHYAAAAEVIRQGDNGLTVGLNDEAAFVTAATSLAADPMQLSKLRQMASSSVSHLDWEQIHDDFSSILGRVFIRHDLVPKTGAPIILPAG